MDFKQIQELIKTVNRSNIGEISIEEGDFKITIKQKEDHSAASAPVSYAPAAAQAVTPAPVAAQQALPSAATPSAAAEKAQDDFITIKSPMIGTFYRSSGPDKAAFVSIGDEVSIGKTVCIIEAMKLFNEIESEVKGTIVKVLVEDASPVEFDQPLFLVEPA